MSIRLRLTLLYTGLLALVLVAFGSAVYYRQSRRVREALEAGLDRAAQLVILGSEGFVAAGAGNGPAEGPGPAPLPGALRGDPFLPPAPGDPGFGNGPGAPAGRAGRSIPAMAFPELPERLPPPLSYAQTRAPDGDLLDRSIGLEGGALPLDETDRLALMAGTPSTALVLLDGERLLVRSHPVREGERVLGILQVATSLAFLDDYLRHLRANLLLLGCIIFLGFGAGWVVAGKALEPIQRITDAARQIGAERDFDRRVDHRGPQDEVGRLATTFNAMLEELQAAYRQVETALQSQRRFVADASHELRTPLTTIRGNSELLRRVPPISPEDRAAVLTDIVAETERLMALVNELLVLARADAHASPPLEAVALRPVVDDLARQVGRLVPDRRLELAVPPDLAACANPEWLRRVLLNLLENALKHSPPGASITISAARIGDRVRIQVHDAGPGIDPARLPQIFERFYRGDGARSGDGSGLGLAIAKALTEAQGGSISVESSPGAGTTFAVELARAEDLHEAAPV